MITLKKYQMMVVKMAKKSQVANENVEANVEMQNILLHPLSTEKSMRLIEAENKVVFVVDRRATKQQIREAVESLYGLKVDKVNVLINRDGKKQAYIKLSDESSAIDFATDLGIM